MDAIARPWDPRPGGLLSDMPLPLLVVLGVLVAGAGVLAAAELVPLVPARAIGAGGAQGALLATAVAWAAPRGSRGRPAPVMAAAVALAGVLAAGAPLGGLLGAHLLVTASLTLGYGARVPTPGELAPWLAYDVGANVLTTEAFFRGALFDRAQRRWPFAAAAAFVTAACLARYLVDPLLPRSLEVTAGAVFYLTLLSLGNCWLYWRSGSIVPGVAAGVAFFVSYRLLHAVP